MLYRDYLKNKYQNTAVKLANAEGVPCVLEYSKGKNMRNYEVYANSVQDGTPSPDTPIEIQSVGDLVTDTASEYYGKYDVPITVRGKNLLPNSDWMSGAHSTGFTEHTNVDYITEYTQNSISFNLAAWKGVSSPRFRKDSVKRIVFKINQTALNSDSYANFYIVIQGYDDNNNKVGNQTIYNNAVADTEYIFDFSTIASYNWYANSTQFSFCVLARKNALSNLMVYDIAYYAETDTAVYEPYKGSQTTHIYLDEPLRKVGDYADYIDFKNQKVVRKVKEKQLVGAEQWSRYPAFKGFYSGISDMLIQNDGYGFCSHYPRITNPNNMGVRFGVNNIVAYFTQLYTDENPLTTNEWKAKLAEWNASGNPLKVTYILAESTEENISLPALKTFKGTNVMSVDTSVQPSNIKAKYIRT